MRTSRPARVAEPELVQGRSARHPGEALERLAAARLDRPTALGPQPVGDRAPALARARARRADQPQEPRPARLLLVQQRAGDAVDRLGMQLRRVYRLAVGQLDRVAIDSMSRSISPCAAAPSRSPSAPTSLMRCRAAAIAEAMRGSSRVCSVCLGRAGGRPVMRWHASRPARGRARRCRVRGRLLGAEPVAAGGNTA